LIILCIILKSFVFVEIFIIVIVLRGPIAYTSGEYSTILTWKEYCYAPSGRFRKHAALAAVATNSSDHSSPPPPPCPSPNRRRPNTEACNRSEGCPGQVFLAGLHCSERRQPDGLPQCPSRRDIVGWGMSSFIYQGTQIVGRHRSIPDFVSIWSRLKVCRQCSSSLLSPTAFGRLIISPVLLVSKDCPLSVFILCLPIVMLSCYASVETVKLILHSGVDIVT